MSTVEIAELLNLSRQRVDKLSRGERFPAPAAELAIGRVWKRDDVVAWATETGRLPQSGPPLVTERCSRLTHTSLTVTPRRAGDVARGKRGRRHTLRGVHRRAEALARGARRLADGARKAGRLHPVLRLQGRKTANSARPTRLRPLQTGSSTPVAPCCVRSTSWTHTSGALALRRPGVPPAAPRPAISSSSPAAC
jgi:hypothetical protein